MDPETLALKEEGDKYFKSGNYKSAKRYYSNAITKNPSSYPVLYTNRATCYLHLEKPQKALSDANAAIEINPQWVRGYQRKAEALIALNKSNEAYCAITSALDINPMSRECREICYKIRLYRLQNGKFAEGTKFTLKGTTLWLQQVHATPSY